MPKFTIVGEITISLHTMVEAETEAEAIRIATDERGLTTIHDHGKPEEVWRTSGELDSVPKNIRIWE